MSRLSYGHHPTKFGSKFEETHVQPIEIFEEWEVFADESVAVNRLPTFDSRFNFTEIKGSKRNWEDLDVSINKNKLSSKKPENKNSFYKLSKIGSTMKNTLKSSMLQSDMSPVVSLIKYQLLLLNFEMILYKNVIILTVITKTYQNF